MQIYMLETSTKKQMSVKMNEKDENHIKEKRGKNIKNKYHSRPTGPSLQNPKRKRPQLATSGSSGDRVDTTTAAEVVTKVLKMGHDGSGKMDGHQWASGNGREAVRRRQVAGSFKRQASTG